MNAKRIRTSAWIASAFFLSAVAAGAWVESKPNEDAGWILISIVLGAIVAVGIGFASHSALVAYGDALEYDERDEKRRVEQIKREYEQMMQEEGK